MHYLRQSTASQEVPLGYFVDSTDGNTEETGLTIANTDIKIWKTGATTLANKNSGGGTHISNGIYYAVLDATDTDTIGPLTIFCHPSGALATRLQCCVLDEAVYDAMFGTVALATATNITAGTITTATSVTNGVTVTTNNDKTGYRLSATGVDDVWDEAQSGHTTAGTFGRYLDAQVANVEADTQDIQSRLPAALVSGRMDSSVGAMAANVLTASAIASDAITDAKVASDVTIASVTGAVGSVTAAVTVGTNNDKTGYALSAAGIQAIWDALTSALTTVGSIGKLLVDNINATISSRLASASYTAPLDAAGTRTAIGLASANLDTQLADIPTNAELAAAVANVSVDEIQASALADLFNTNSGTTYASAVAGSVVKEIADNAGGSSLTVQDIVDGVFDEAAGAHTGIIATGIPAIKTKTDQLAFTVTGQVDANAESMNGSAILGNGTSGDLWRGA